jgi:hypothetical protein
MWERFRFYVADWVAFLALCYIKIGDWLLSQSLKIWGSKDDPEA